MEDQLAVAFYVHRFSDEESAEGGEEAVPELALTASPALLGELFVQNSDHSGELVITSPGNPEVRIRDSLDALVMQLCFEALEDLIAEKHVVVRHYLMYGYIRMDPEGDLTLLSGDYLPSVRVERAALIAALFQAGERYLALIRSARSLDAQLDDLLTMLEGYYADAVEVMREAQG
jgi:hypothetical protein